MCKLMMMCGIPANKSKLAAKFIKKSVPYMTKEDQDGLGYVALGDQGIFGERWLNIENAFKSRRRYTKNQEVLNKFFGSSVTGDYENYTKFGKVDFNNARSILFHTRYATCGKNMKNTHPFVIGDTALIHNGVILNHADVMSFHDDCKISTCDSEAILQEYLASEVNESPENIQDIAEILDGWYACGVLTKNNEGKDFVDIFKCRNSSLYVGLVAELECFVFCTDIEILQNTAKDMKMNVVAYDEFVGGKFIRIDAITGDRLELIDFKPEADKELLNSFKKQEDFREWDIKSEKWDAA